MAGWRLQWPFFEEGLLIKPTSRCGECFTISIGPDPGVKMPPEAASVCRVNKEFVCFTSDYSTFNYQEIYP